MDPPVTGRAVRDKRQEGPYDSPAARQRSASSDPAMKPGIALPAVRPRGSGEASGPKESHACPGSGSPAGGSRRITGRSGSEGACLDGRPRAPKKVAE